MGSSEANHSGPVAALVLLLHEQFGVVWEGHERYSVRIRSRPGARSRCSRYWMVRGVYRSILLPP